MDSITKSDIDSAIGKILKDYRVKNHLTQEQMAEKLGISVKYVSRIENGNGGVKIETLVHYMNLLGIAPNVVFKDLVRHDEIQWQLDLSDKVSELSQEKIAFLLSFIDSLKDFHG